MQTPSISTFTRRILMAGAMLSLIATSSHAAIVTWGTPQTISGDTDVSTAGTLVGAFNVGDTGVAGATVNGVAFQGFAVPQFSNSATNGNFSLSVNGADVFLGLPNGSFGSTSTPFTSLTTGYKALLDSGTFTAQPTTFDLTISGLTFGQTYQFQWWANFSGAPFPGDSPLHSATTGISSVNLNDNVAGVEGGLGQYVTGTFVADGTSQTITFGPVPPTGPNSFAQLNAFQLRQIPEPSSLGLLGVGLMALGLRARCGRKH